VNIKKDAPFFFYSLILILYIYKHSIKISAFFSILVLTALIFALSLNKTGQKFLFLNLADLNSLSIEVSFMVDIFARVFLFTVFLISSAVFSFRFSYISPQKIFWPISRSFNSVCFFYGTTCYLFKFNFYISRLRWFRC